MGAEQFFDVVTGKNAEEAFGNAVETALYDYGHAGYTGTIAEKHSFIEIEVPDDFKARPFDYAEYLVANDDPRVDDKWGPAGCIKLAEGKYVFFGWASS